MLCFNTIKFFVSLLTKKKGGIPPVAGESLIKERAAARFNDLVGSLDVVAAWLKLNNIWRTNTKAKGFFIEKVKGGYSVAIAGFITFLPFRRFKKRKKRYQMIDSPLRALTPKGGILWCSNSGRSNKNLMSEIC
ncbi:hypothetical protein CICLE_v10017151mg [Citrus x clementina]|uniref:Ribosomal protein S1 n=1 Tax=Citrus clementina TaxID=85681 RepID=V4UD62_CITCL|nr:hypothetical protein CICLE_v10017151mg [Citrus x clementina]